jgi:Flp pilus assembly protein TadG
MHCHSRVRRLVRSESGAELIEFSLTLPLLLLIVLGIIEFGLMFREYEVVTNAAREGARIAILPSYTDADVRARIDDYLGTAGLNLSNRRIVPNPIVPVTSLVNGAGSPCISVVPVTVEYDHAVPFVSGIATYFGATIGTMTLRATSRMRREIPAGAC